MGDRGTHTLSLSTSAFPELVEIKLGGQCGRKKITWYLCPVDYKVQSVSKNWLWVLPRKVKCSQSERDIPSAAKGLEQTVIEIYIYICDGDTLQLWVWFFCQAGASYLSHEPPGPVLSDTLSSVAFSDGNSLGKKYRIKKAVACPSAEVTACTSL